MIDPNKPITVTMPAGHYNVLMAGLYELPYKHAQPIIDELRRQIREVEPGAFVEGSFTSAPRVNGIDVRE